METSHRSVQVSERSQLNVTVTQTSYISVSVTETSHWNVTATHTSHRSVHWDKSQNDSNKLQKYMRHCPTGHEMQSQNWWLVFWEDATPNINTQFVTSNRKTNQHTLSQSNEYHTTIQEDSKKTAHHTQVCQNMKSGLPLATQAGVIKQWSCIKTFQPCYNSKGNLPLRNRHL